MLLKSAVRKLAFISTILLLIGCTPEQSYRGVPAVKWQHLTAEQKQLIVDKAFQDEMKK